VHCRAPQLHHKPVHCGDPGGDGEASVFVGAKHFGGLTPATALAVAFALSGCSNFDTSGAWFSKPLNLFGANLGYTYSQLDEARRDRPITANDLVSADGACPRQAVAAPEQTASASPDASVAGSPDAAALLGGGVAIGMSECDVVARLGQPTAVNIGRSPNGDRAAVLTFNGGPRPGVYRFAGGRLKEMDRVELPSPPPEPAKKKVVKKKPEKTNEPPKTDDKS
jgi:hypothetical protein